MQLTGKAIIRVDGQEWRCEDGASLDVGGVKREAKAGGGKVHGYTPPYCLKPTPATAMCCAMPLCWNPASWRPRTVPSVSNSAA